MTYTFKEGDIVLVKCEDRFPEIAKIESFKGFDAHNFEVYKIRYLQKDNWALLQQFYLLHLTLKNI